MKTILTGLAFVFFSFSSFCQIEKPKTTGTITKPKTNTTSTATSKKIATVEVKWKGPGAAKIIVGANEFYLTEGGVKTIQLNAGEGYSPSVHLSEKQVYDYTGFIIPDGGKGFLEISISNNVMVANYSSEKQITAARKQDSLRAISLENTYGFMVVIVGTQVWEAENLNSSRFRNGDFFPEAKTRNDWVLAFLDRKPIWCYYDFDPANEMKYGKLYNKFAVTDSRGLAPLGWHIPNDLEYAALKGFKVNNSPSYELNSYKFEAAKRGHNVNVFVALTGGELSTSFFSGEGESFGLWFSNGFTRENPVEKEEGTNPGFSVRCIKD